MPDHAMPAPRRMSLDQAHDHARTLLEAGRVAEAEQVCRRILQVRPDHDDALHLLGLCLLQKGEHAEAAGLLDQVLARRPGEPAIWDHRARALLALGRHDDALASCDRAIALRPGYAEAHFVRGSVLRELGRGEEALAAYDRVVALSPVLAEGWSNRGNLLMELNRQEEALASYERAIALQPAHAGAWNNRGNLLRKMRRPDEALASYERAIALRPEHAGAWNNRGNVLEELLRPEEAMACYERAIALSPGYAEAHANLGGILRERNRLEEAMASYDRALALRPDLPYARGHWLSTRLLACAWDGLDDARDALLRAVAAGEARANPFLLLTVPASPALRRQCAQAYAEDKHPAAPTPLWRGERYGHGRIRVGYFSSDFRNHAVSFLTAELFERHDRSRFETFAFSFGPDTGDAMRRRLEGAFDHFLDVRERSDAEIAALSREREIDIAVDLNGYTTGCRPGIFARRPVPAQVNYLGYPGTLGAAWMDYLLADGTVIPPEHEACYSERVIRLPHSFQVNDSTRAIADTPMSRAGAGLPEAGFVFCCFNNNYKLSPDAFDVWMRLLDRVPGSVLWLYEGHPVAARNLRGEAAKRGVDPQRLVFAPQVALDDYLARYRLADLFLDTFHYNAGTTASHALWAGLPVLTRLGESFAGRMAASLLGAIGLPELVTDTTEAYEALALELARDPARLAGIKAKLAANRLTEPLFDTARFTRHIEAAYVRIWERAEAGLPAQAMDIEALDSGAGA